MANKIMKPNYKTRTKSKATAKAKPGNKPVEKNPWEIAVLELFLKFRKIEEEGIDSDLSEELYDTVHIHCGVSAVNLNLMIDEYRNLKKEAERFKKILAMKTLQDAWKSLSGEQQELLRDMDARSFVNEVTE